MVLGIVAEYNPFHNGHLYHLLKSKEEAKANAVVAVISGNFVQRGDPSIVDKWTKAEMALANGVDLVIELPVLYATSSAENFSDGAIKILNSLKVVDKISFGSESEDLTKLNLVANTLFQESKEYKELLAKYLSLGKSFPKARSEALIHYLDDRDYSIILSGSNNILGIEYLKALKKNGSTIKPICIKRKDTGHLSLDYNGEIANATAIRSFIYKSDMKSVKTYTTPSSYTILEEEIKKGHFVCNLLPYENTIIYNLRHMSLEDIAALPDVSEGLEHSIKKAANSCNSISEFINIVSTKRYTSTRINRILLYSLLHITKRDMDIAKKSLPYIRVLGFNDIGQNLLSKIARINPKLPIITSVKKFQDTNNNRSLKLMLDKDIFATNVYTLGYLADSWSNLDFTKKVIKRI